MRIHPSPTGTFTSRQTRFGFPDESITVSYDGDDDDDKIQYSLRFVWLTVQEALLEGPGVIERLADRDGFEASVEPDGEKRSRYGKEGIWLDTIENMIMFKHILDDTNPSQLPNKWQSSCARTDRSDACRSTL
ncbi:hypothetical protein BGY98DRAFT_939106 [Russula aff. rugulosa BPL654]|nr:hypothetical protein BGY98DRAFT_939106 [Russula aff. rugulosa BPL654]